MLDAPAGACGLAAQSRKAGSLPGPHAAFPRLVPGMHGREAGFCRRFAPPARSYDSSLKGEVVGAGQVLPAGQLNGTFRPDCAHSSSTCGGWAGLPFW
jgi:hypothetical protein